MLTCLNSKTFKYGAVVLILLPWAIILSCQRIFRAKFVWIFNRLLDIGTWLQHDWSWAKALTAHCILLDCLLYTSAHMEAHTAVREVWLAEKDTACTQGCLIQGKPRVHKGCYSCLSWCCLLLLLSWLIQNEQAVQLPLYMHCHGVGCCPNWAESISIDTLSLVPAASLLC